jgi:hypothetical protein
MRNAAGMASLGVLVAVGLAGLAAASEAPPIQIAAPEPGCTAQVGDKLQVLVVVSPGLDVATVVVMCDARGLGMAEKPPYAFEWDTSEAGAGDHVLRAFVYLKSGEKAGATPVTVTLVVPQASAQLAASALPPTILKEGTPVLLQTQEKMVSGQIAEGAPVRYKIARDVVAPGGQLLVAYGDFGEGRVTRSRRRGMFGKAGQLEFTVDAATAVDGTRVPLRSSQQMAGKDNKGVVIASTLLLSVLAVFVHGKDVDLPAGTEVMAYVDHDTPVQPSASEVPTGAARGEPQEAATITAPTQGQVFDAGQRIEVRFSVTPERKFGRATLYVDGKESGKVERQLSPFALNARSLGPGTHTVEVEVQFLSGYVLRTAPVQVSVKQG